MIKRTGKNYKRTPKEEKMNKNKNTSYGSNSLRTLERKMNEMKEVAICMYIGINCLLHA